MNKLSIWQGIIRHCSLRGELYFVYSTALECLTDSEMSELYMFGAYHFYYESPNINMSINLMANVK